MFVVTNRAYIFPTTLEEIKGKAIVFEVSSLSGNSTLYVSDINSLNGVSRITDTPDEEPMPKFGDILYLLLQLKFEEMSLTSEPDQNKITIFIPGGTSQVEITYHKANDEFRILSTSDFTSVSNKVKEVLNKISPRVVEFMYYDSDYFGDSEAPDTSETEIKEEKKEEEGESSLLQGVSELEKMYVESEKDTEEVKEEEREDTKSE